ncbi:unnamed protein product [Auanema sp. JU1783]|nr:unnamed protein product [Auanema sp. JU1783]
MSSYYMLNKEPLGLNVPGRMFKILTLFAITALLGFLFFNQKSVASNFDSSDKSTSPVYSVVCSTSQTAVEEQRIPAPVLLDSSDPTFAFTFAVRRNIDKLLSGKITGSNIKPFGSIYEQFKVAHALKLASCENPKGMSTVLMNMMCYLYDEEKFLGENNNIASTWWSNSACNFRNALPSHRDVEKNMPFGVNHIAVIRNPFSRFVSAYLNKCVVEVNQGIHGGCYNCSTAEEPNCIIENVYERLTTENIDKKMNRKTPYYYETYHFAPQTWVCQMKEIYKSTAFIRYADFGSGKREMYSNIVSTLRAFNVPTRNVDYIEKSFESQHKTWHATRSMDERDKLIDNILSNRTLYDMLMDIYKHDFDIFEFSPPSFKDRTTRSAVKKV